MSQIDQKRDDALCRRILNDVEELLAVDIEMRLRALAAAWQRPAEHVISILFLRGLRDAESMRVCRDCACTDYDPCELHDGQPCSWAEEDLCMACAAKKD